MAKASDEFRQAPAKAHLTAEVPAGVRLLSGIDGDTVFDVHSGADKLARQIRQTVNWAGCMESCRAAGATKVRRADCLYVTPRTSSSVTSRSLVFKQTRGHSCGLAMLMVRTFPDSACRPWTHCRRCVCARSATYESQGAEGFRIRCLIKSRTVGFLRRRRIGLGPEEPRNRYALAIIVDVPAGSCASYEC
jgi:hypothetical protein